MRQFLAELVGTFFLMLSICLSVAGGLDKFAPIAIGLTLMVMVYACGHLSGAHFNPAVSLAAIVRGRLTPGESAAYIVSQLVGAVLAAGIAIGLRGSGGQPTVIAHAGSAIAAEFIGAFALVWVILNVATARATTGNSYFGAAIGLAVTALAFFLGGFSGGAFNPAVAIGGAVFGLFRWSDIWIHLLGTVLGGLAAAGAFKATHPGEA